MRIRVFCFLAPAALVVLAAGCSSAGAGSSPGFVPSRSVSVRAALPSEAITFNEFSDLPKNQYAPYYPFALTAGPDGALWVVDDVDQDFGASAVARIDVSGHRTATFYYPNQALPSFVDIVAGEDGNLWIADDGDFQILRVTPTGHFTGFRIPHFNAPIGITNGPDGALWFTMTGYPAGQIGRITTAGKMTVFSHGVTSGAILEDIVAGPDGTLWFTEDKPAGIGRITTDGTIVEYRTGISRGSQPLGITLGPDKALWFTESLGGRIGRITAAGKVTEYSAGISAHEHPTDLAPGPDGAIWFTESDNGQRSRIARILPNGTITEYSGISPDADPLGIARGPDGNMWFVEYNLNRLGRANL